MSPDDDQGHIDEIRMLLRQRWGRLPSCGCPSSWGHECGRRNTPSPDHRDDWRPSPGGQGACGWDCRHRWAGEGNDPDSLRWPCRCSGREAG